MPIANDLRPKSLDEFIGQSHIVGPKSWLHRAILADELSSIILFGPPGSGKTTLAHIIANQTKSNFVQVNATLGTTKQMRLDLEKAREDYAKGKKTIIFVDEIHRFNKAQQDVLLPYVEKGEIVLIGATTENPSFTVIAPLISRSKVFVLNRLEIPELEEILFRAIKKYKLKIDKKAKDIILNESNGDARTLLNFVEDLAQKGKISADDVQDSKIVKTLKYDKSGEEHYNIISALHKSMRDSDPDGALYWMLRMVESGDDPLYIARRLVRFAAEDIGLADPHALMIATSCYQSCHFIGLPECDVILAETVIYLSVAPKSNSSYMAVLQTRSDIRKFGNLDVPKHLRNASTKLMKEFGYGKGYKYAHEFEGAKVDQDHLPDALKNKKYYQPTDHGIEKRIKDKLDR